MKTTTVVWISAAVLLGATLNSSAFAHCDTMDGPVITDAKTALEKGDVTPVLKWVKKHDEARIRTAFTKALVSRKKGTDSAKSDMVFFDSLVKIHRAGEGAPFEGIKPAGTEIEPAVQEADKALKSGNADPLVALLIQKVTGGIKKRFAEALERKKKADESVDLGREYVEAYVEFVHYAEALDTQASGKAGEHHGRHKEGHHQ